MIPNIKHQNLNQVERLIKNWKLKEALAFLDNFNDLNNLSTRERYHFYFLKGSILLDLFAPKEAMKYAKLAINVSKELKSDYDTICALMLKGQIFGSMLKPNDHLKVINEAEKILSRNTQKSSKEYKRIKGYVLLHKGRCQFGIGNLSNSLTLLYKSSQLANEINDKELLLQTIKWLAGPYNNKGEIDRAQEYNKKYLELAIKLNDLQEIIGAHNSLGMVYTEKGNIKLAIKHLEKGLSICYKINSWKTFLLLSSLFDAYLKSNSLEKAQQCHDQMGNLIKARNFKFNEVIYRLQEAALLKKEVNEISLIKAETILKEVTDKETTFIEFKLFALVQLCDLYLLRLKISSNLKELDKLDPYINKIRFIAEREELFSLLAELYLFQAKIKLLTYEFQESQNLLTKSLDIASSKGLYLIVQRIEDEQSELSKNFLKWEKLKKSGGSISERCHLAQIDKQIQILLQKRTYLKTVINN